MRGSIKNYSALVNGKKWISDGAFQFDFTAPANSVQEVLQNVFNIIATPLGSQPLFRIFGCDQSWIDSPGNIAQMQAKTAFLLSVSLWEPRAKITSIKFGLDPTDYVAGAYALFLELEVDLSRSIVQSLVLPPSTTPTWVIDGPVGGELVAQEETLTL